MWSYPAITASEDSVSVKRSENSSVEWLVRGNEKVQCVGRVLRDNRRVRTSLARLLLQFDSQLGSINMLIITTQPTQN